MRISLLTGLVAFVLLSPELPVLQAADTVQDFTATFPADVSGDPLRFAVVDYGSAPGPSVDTLDGWDGRYLRLTEEVNSQSNGVGFNQVHTGDYEELVLQFEFRISVGNGGGADGISVAYLDSAMFGEDTSTPAPQMSEEPNLAGSFGVGFDTFNNAGQEDGGENSVSLHFDGTRIASVPIDGLEIPSFETGTVMTARITVVPGDGGSDVTVEIDDESGNFIVPFENEFVPGFEPYDGRLAFGARTGGANSNQDLDNIVLAIDGNDVLSEDFEEPVAPPEPFSTAQNGSAPGPSVDADGWDGNFLRLTEEVNSQLNSVGFNQAHTGDYDELEIQFDFRISVGNGGGADGVSVAYLDSAAFGEDSSVAPPSMSEEPNLAGSFGVGFDTFNNGADDGGEDSVSLHFDGALIASVPIDGMDIPSFETGTVMRATITVIAAGGDSEVTVEVEDESGNVIVPFQNEVVPGFLPYDGRLAFGARTGGANANQDVDNIQLAIDGMEVLSEDFEEALADVPEPSGGTPFTIVQFGSDPGPGLLQDTGPLAQPQEIDGFLRMTHERGDQIGLVVFDRTSVDSDRIVANFKFRGLDEGVAGRADGGSFLLLDAGVYGSTGANQVPNFNPMEEPNLAGAFGLGFDTFNNNAGPDEVQSPNPNVGNHVSLHWDGQRIAESQFDIAELDLVNGVFNDVTVELTRVEEGTVATVVIVDGTDDSEHVAFDEMLIEGMAFDTAARVALAGRTGGAADNYDFDDLLVTFERAELTTEGDTLQDFTATFFPEARLETVQYGSGPPPSIDPDGWDGNFLRLTEEVNSQLNGVGFNQAHTGEYDEMEIQFEFRISVGNGGGADGVSVAYLDSLTFGADTSTDAPQMSEEPNLAGSFGVGFDTFNNTGQEDGGENSVSLHFDGARIASVPIDGTAIPSFETDTVMTARITVVADDGGSEVTVEVEDEFGNFIVPFESEFVPGFLPYDGRLAFGARTGGANSNQDLDNILLAIDGSDVLFEDFEDPGVGEPAVPSGGTPFVLVQLGSDPGPELLPQGDPPAQQPEEGEGFLRIAHETGSQVGLTVFDQTSSNTQRFVATFDLRGLDEGAAGRADGASFLLLDVATYGTRGAGLVPNFNPMEEPNLTGAFGVGFDTFNNNQGPDGVQTPNPNVGNHLSVHWDGERLGETRFDVADIDLVGGEFNNVTVEIDSVAGGYNATVRIVDGTDGSEHVAFDNLFIEGMEFPQGARAAFAARTGGAADNYDVDNVRVRFGEAPDGPLFVRGDANSDGTINLTDGIEVLAFLFGGGDAPGCMDAGDFDDASPNQLTITDAVAIFTWLFGGGDDPPAPTPSIPSYRASDCGPDPTDDDGIDCAQPSVTCTP